MLAAAHRYVTGLRNSGIARTSLVNAVYGIGDYIAQPVAMLLAARFLLHRLGLSQYGVWMLVAAAISGASLVCTGFGDAALKYAALYRGRENRAKLEQILRVNLTINLVLSCMLAALIWCGSPLAASNWFKIDVSLRAAATSAFRIGSVILVVRSIESVFVGALRAHERYGPSVQISVLSRLAIVASACALVSRGHGIVAIMVATLALVTASAILQITAAWMVIGPMSLVPTVGRNEFLEVFGFGCYSWLQAVAGCIFNQADRMLIGVLLGTSAVASYSVCIQAAQPIHGLIAAGLHFVFPHLSARLSTAQVTELKTVVRSIFWLNLALAALLCVPLLLFSELLLRLWIGPAFAQQTWMVLSIIAAGFGLLGLNVTGHYALLALGQARLVALLNLAGGAAMLVAMVLLAPQLGLVGVAVGRFLYGPVTLLMYWHLPSLLSPRPTAHSEIAAPLVGGELEPE
jgi:O-antigen/teichoic acid export membrane protein